jgi:hypothetical protein
MELRFYIDPETDQPHIYGHGVTEDEVWQVMRAKGDDVKAEENTRMKLGQTEDGRYLQVIYSPDDDQIGFFIVTAFPLAGKAKRAFRRRRKRKP